MKSKRTDNQRIGTRVRTLVELRHGGSIKAAAKATGIPYPTLRGIVQNEIDHPRSDAVRKLARTYGVTTDWLLEGIGDGPHERTTIDWQSALGDWWKKLHDLGLPTDVFELWAQAPLGPWAALVAIANQLKVQDANETQHASISWRSVQLAAQAWTTVLDDLIQLYGRERIKRALSEIPEHVVRGGFAQTVSVLIAARMQAEAKPEGPRGE